MHSVTAQSLPIERQKDILERLSEHGRVLAAELAAEFDVSEHTIRRDLRELAAAGLCQRVYSGAVLLSPSGEVAVQRVAQHRAAKQALGQTAARLLRAHQCVFFDAGTTNLSIAQHLPATLSLTAVTNCPAIADALAPRPLLEVIVIGGRMNAHAGGATGASAVAQLQQIRFDLAFVGACAIDVDAGVTVFDSEDAAFKRAVLSASGQIAAAVTNEKLGTMAHHRVATLSQLDWLIVEADATEQRLAAIRHSGVEIIAAA